MKKFKLLEDALMPTAIIFGGLNLSSDNQIQRWVGALLLMFGLSTLWSRLNRAEQLADKCMQILMERTGKIEETDREKWNASVDRIVSIFIFLLLIGSLVKILRI